MLVKNSCILFLLAMVLSANVYSQSGYTVTIEVNSNSNTHQENIWYITGNFNAWDPRSTHLGDASEGNSLQRRVILRNIKEGLMEFKFTRGTWQTLECTDNGTLTAPRQALIRSDTTLKVDIRGWRDDFPTSTASKQVHQLDSAFYIPQLDVYRPIWIYLPEDYHRSQNRYPVIYMHDGQDLFDEATSKGRIGPLEWGVDETIDEHNNSAIVVAVAHAGDKDERQNEYFVSPNKNFPTPLGKQYIDFIVNTLKPYIDNNYNTLPDRENTSMVGSSVAGLLTLYAGLSYPDIFGTLGVFSPSIWLDEGQIQERIANINYDNRISSQQYYFYAGGNENRAKPDGTTVKMNADVIMITELLKEKSNPIMEININPEGKHGAWYWAKAFPDFYNWWQKQLKSHSNNSNK